MPDARAFAAVDLGAESGRVMIGRLDGSSVSLEVVHRFPNRPVWLPDGLHWNLPQLFSDSLDGIARAAATERLDGIGIDAWGVDYALLDGSYRMLGLPFHYRDERTHRRDDGSARTRWSRREALYARTGIQTMPINTIFQLMAERDSGAAKAAERIALVSDLFGLWLTGELANEATIASTSGLLEARGRSWALDLLARLGLPERPFTGEVIEPGRPIGAVLERHAMPGGPPVHAVAGHDTASAFVAAPLRGEDDAVLSSGTWSLLGLEVREPILGARRAAYNLTNERGVDGTIRLLSNVMGSVAAAGMPPSLERGRPRARLRRAAPARVRGAPRRAVVRSRPRRRCCARGDMPSLIAAACAASGQVAPAGPGELIRSILISLACKYRLVLERLQKVTGRRIAVLHVVGGGIRNPLLCQLTADLLGLPVLAGPEEATALGNVLVQARSCGELGSLVQMRELVAASIERDSIRAGGGHPAVETYERFESVTGLMAQGPARAMA